jgi:hypothetical protein
VLLLLLMKKIDYHFPKRGLMKIVEKVLNVEKDHPMLVLNDQKNLNVFVVVVAAVVVVVLVHSEMIDKNMNFL